MLNALLLCISAGCQSPPAQPQTRIGVEFVAAVNFMLQHGFGDPRNGKFSRATVTSNSSWDGGGRPMEIEGWLLPETPGKPRMIVATNGLVYPTLSVLGDANVKELAVSKTGRLSADPFQETQALAAVLLIANETKLAESVLSSNRRVGEQRPFLALANAYLTARFHRAVEAHMRGDDALALADAKALQAERPAFELEGVRILGQAEVDRRADPGNGGTGKPMVFRYLEPLDVLIEDSERRLKEKRKPLDMGALKQLPQAERIAKLIENLDEVSARQWGQPGGVGLDGDPIVAALIQEGEAAVDPLLDVLEKDVRLTRSVSFGRDFFPDRNLIKVKDAAFAAFRAIFQVNTFTSNREDLSVAALRAYAAENKGLTPPERWYATMADDEAGRERWMEAAARLVESPQVRRVGDWVTIPPKDDQSMKGEPMRNRTPSLSDFMAKRAKQIVTTSERNSSSISFALGDALTMGLYLYKWDARASLPTLQWVCKEAMQPFGSLQSYVFDHASRLLAQATIVRIQLKDDKALGQFGEWLLSMDSTWTSHQSSKVFAPIAANPGDPQVTALSKRLFTDPASPWNLVAISKQSVNGLYRFQNLVFSPLLANEYVVEAVEEVLGNKDVIGKTWRGQRSMHYSIEGPHGTGSGSLGLPNSEQSDPLAPKDEVKVDLRACDKLAMQFSSIEGIPTFRPYWPVAEKDRAIREMAAFLKSNRNKIAELLPWPDNWENTPRPRKQ